MSNRVLFVLTGFGVSLLLAAESSSREGIEHWSLFVPSMLLAVCCGVRLGEVVREWRGEH